MNLRTLLVSKPGAIVLGTALLIVIALLLPRAGTEPANNVPGDNVLSLKQFKSGSNVPTSPNLGGQKSHTSPEEVVTRKLGRFARDRLSLLKSMAQHFNAPVHPDIPRFFAAVEAQDFSRAKELFESLQKHRDSELEGAEGLRTLWAPIMETYGTLEVVEEWPAQSLLDYGEAILSSLKPGMVYLGGTDAGRFIPTLLNETSGGERHVILTQNAFADNSYLDYVRFLYGEQLNVFSPNDSTSAFQNYIADAQKRWQHDANFPEEAKQVRPGEDIGISENRVQVSGQVAVMAINERLLMNLMKQNPEASFAIEESFPFKSLYGETVPLGPILQLGAGEQSSGFSEESAQATLEYWRTAAVGVIARSSLSDAEREAYAKMAAAQAGLLAAKSFSTEAEETYRIAVDLAPSSPELAYRFANFLAEAGRVEEARQVLQKLPAPHQQSATP